MRTIATILIIMSVALLAASLPGCAAVNGNAQVHAANGEIRAINVQTRADAKAIKDDAEKLWSMVSEKCKPLLDDITKRAANIADGSQRSDAATIKSDAAGDALAADNHKKEELIDKQNNSWGMRLERFVNHVLLIIGIALGIAALGWTLFRLATALLKGSPLSVLPTLLEDVGKLALVAWGAIRFAGGLLGKIPLIGKFFGGGSPPPNPFSSL